MVETGVMLKGAKPFTDGNVNQTWIAQIRLMDKSTIGAYAKAIPLRAIFVECVCAILGQQLNIAIPTPLIIQIHHEVMPDKIPPGKTCICFGSKDVGYPSFKRRYLETKWDIFLRECINSHNVAGFDEWIGNYDRNVGNILYGGNGEFSFIDHERSLEPSLMPEQPATCNHIMNAISDGKTELDKYRIKNDIRRDLLDVIDREFIKQLSDIGHSKGLLPQTEAEGIILFLETRLTYINDLILDRLDIRQREFAL